MFINDQNQPDNTHNKPPHNAARPRAPGRIVRNHAPANFYLIF